MDEVGTTQQYYIAAGSSPSEDRTRVLKYGTCFAVFNRYGDMEPFGLGEHGIFFRSCRHLSEFVLDLWNARPLLLSSNVQADNFAFVADLANVDITQNESIVVPRGTLHLVRSRFLWRDVAHEELRIINYGLTSLRVPIRIAFAADFADIFEVRGMRREHRGRRLDDEVTANSILMTYEGLDRELRRTCIHSDPEPLSISSSELQFEASLGPGKSATFHLSIDCNPETRHRSIGYDRAMAGAETELKAASSTLCRISSSNDRLTSWVRRSLADVEMMTLGNPETNYPYAGVPWFSTVFGRDGIITALQMLWIAPQIAKGVLHFLASTQATEIDLKNEAQPGKIIHETRHGEMAKLGEIPFGRYYGSIDSTPLFLILAGRFFDYTGDVKFLEHLRPHIDMALDWIDRFGDVDGDGFVEYAPHGEKGLVQQGWKDSNDSVFHVDGTIAEPPIALCEVQGYVYAAKMAAAKIYAAWNDKERQRSLESEAAELQHHFEEAFWCDEISTYALALDGHKQPCRVRTSNPGHCLFSGIASPERANLVAHTLISKDFFSGWGIRTVGCHEARYNPLSYHNGSVWPHDNAIIAAGMARYDFREFAGRILMSLLDLSSSVELQRLPELFCGVDRRPGQGPTLYPVACSPQSWAAGAVFMLLQSCLGITVDAKSRRIIFDRPYLPQGIPQLSIRDLRIEDCRVNLFLERDSGPVRIQVVEKHGEVDVVVK
ncbi:MAG TPA: amylo-alpha-1,6-glucosidase [Candidatus Sulfotelmatobacter sp.]|nr:amylo-alpha-1,6-glucosidase [Candidatus Sulfotelmatobacter sp.]